LKIKLLPVRGTGQDHFTGFDDKIIAMYARSMTVCGAQGFLAEQYDAEVSPISSAASPKR